MKSKLIKKLKVKKGDKLFKKYGPFAIFEVKCASCDSPIKVEERFKRHPRKENYFCDCKCAGTFGANKQWTDPDLREKMIESRKSQEYKDKMSKIFKGREFSKEHRKKLSEAHKGISISQEHVDKMAKVNKERYRKKYGKFKIYEVECTYCGDVIKVKERTSVFPSKEKYFCNQSCANGYIMKNKWAEEDFRKERTKKLQEAAIKNWSNPEYIKKLKCFSSKAERFIRDFFIENFPEDNWAFGGTIKYNNIHLARDLYSDKLKVCFEYDGIWHFEDICGQLSDKQKKDKALENWCKENNYRLIRLDAKVFKENLKQALSAIYNAIYKKDKQFIKLGKRY